MGLCGMEGVGSVTSFFYRGWGGQWLEIGEQAWRNGMTELVKMFSDGEMDDCR